MADENNDALLQEINALLDQLKEFPENREDATEDEKKQITKIYKQLFEKESYKHTQELDDEHKAIHRSGQYINEKKAAFISVQPFFSLQDRAKYNDKEGVSLCFREIFEQVANDYKLSTEEKSILATYMPIFGAEAKSVLATMQNQADILAKLNAQVAGTDTPQPMSEEDKEKVTQAFTAFQQQLPKLDDQGHIQGSGSVKKLKDDLDKAIEGLNTALKDVQGTFSAKQIEQFNAMTEPYHNIKDKKGNRLRVNIDSRLEEKANAKNKNAPSAAFKQLYSQHSESVDKTLARELNSRLRSVFTQVQEQLNVSQNETGGNETNSAEGNETGGNETNPAEDNEAEGNEEPPALSPDEIKTYLDEIRQSDNEESYLSGISPKISDANIIASMALEEVKDNETGDVKYTAVQARALALCDPDNLLVAYQYYQNDPEKLAEVEAVIAEGLRNTDHANLNPENAFVWLTLADKIKDNKNYESAYETFTTGLASQMRQFDQENYKGLTAEKLAQNYEAAKQGLEGLDDAFLQSLIKDYTFTDDKGKPLTDKNRGKLNPMRYIDGKGNDRSEILDSLFETARLMAAQELATEGLPADPARRQENLESKMREQMAKILSLNVDPRLIEGANLVANISQQANEQELKNAQDLLEENKRRIENYFSLEKQKIEDEATNKAQAVKNSKKKNEKLQEIEEEKNAALKNLEKKRTDDLALANQNYQRTKAAYDQSTTALSQQKQETLQQLLAGNEDTIRNIAILQAQKELGYPLDATKVPDFGNDEAKRREYNLKIDKYQEALKDGQKKSTTWTKNELGARLGGVMTKVHEFQTRNHQHFKGTELDKKSNSWWNKLDQKLTERFGAPYTEGKKWTKKIGKIAWNVGKGIAIASTVSAVAGPLGVAALTGYYAVKQWKNVATQLKDKEASGWKKAALIAGAVATTSLTAVTAMAGIGGMESISNALGNPAILQNCSNVTSSLGIAGRAAINAAAVTLPNWVERQVIRNKRKKLDKQIAETKDPKEMADLLQQHKELEVRRMRNNEELITKGIAVSVGLGIGGAINAHASSPSNGVESATAPASMPPAEQAATADPLTITPSEIQPIQAGMGGELFANADGTLQPELTQGTDSITADTNATPQAGAEATQVGPLTEDGNFLSAEAQAQQQAEANLSTAQEAGTGWRGQSSYDSAHNNLNDYKGSLGMNDQQVDAATQKLCEVYGNQAYMATHAALAEPAHLAEEMGIPISEINQQPGENLSAQMLSYLQTHDMSGNEGFNSYMEAHFHTDQQLFTPSERPAPVYTGEHIATHQPAAHINTAAENTPPVQPQGFHYEVVDHLPGQQPQQTQPQVAVAQNQPPVYQQTQTVYMPQQQYSEYRHVSVYAPNGECYDKFIGTMDKTTGLICTGAVVDHNNQYYREYVDPNTGQVVHHQTSRMNIQQEAQHSNPTGPRVSYTHGGGYIAYEPDKVDLGIVRAHASLETAQGIADDLHHMGVLDHKTTDKIIGGGNIGHRVTDLIGVFHHTRA